MSHWTQVDEELPPSCVNVMLFARDNEGRALIDVGHVIRDDKGRLLAWAWRRPIKPTHWQPLPTPPA